MLLVQTFTEKMAARRIFDENGFWSRVKQIALEGMRKRVYSVVIFVLFVKI